MTELLGWRAFASGSSGVSLRPSRHFDTDFEGRHRTPRVHLDLNLVGFDRYVFADGGKDLLAKDPNKIGSARRRPLMGEQDL